MLERILLAVDGSKGALDAARLLATLPLAAGTKIDVVCVISPYIERLLESVREGIGHHAQRVVQAAVEIVEREGLLVRETERTDLLADLVIVGARGVSRIEGLLTGSVADRLLAEATCSVMVVRSKPEPEAAR